MDTPHAPRNPILVEDLTERELDVLRLKAQNRSNQEIADELVLALSTVKWYVRQVYGKLGVENQRQAVARAQAIGLIEGSPTPGCRPRHNLPAQTSPFIGREQERADLTALLADPEVRLITILAPGGMGKTRLGLALAEAHADRFADGVFMVPLAPLRSPDQIVTAVAEATYFPFSQDGRSARHQVLDFLRNKHMLLLLDNFEHLLAGAEFVTEILQAAPTVKIVVTTRERLNLSSETVYNIGGMIFPDWETPENVFEYDAVKLFRKRAAQLCPGLEIQPDDLRYLVRICRLVEGMPLGIILAAAWTEVLSLGEIADEIQSSFDFLAAEMRDVPRRQWSIRAVFEPTWQRLNDTEQDAFMRFAVFRGGCTRDAAQAVTGADLRTLQALINKALVDRDSAGRYHMHELLRQYAEKQLAAAGEVEAVRNAHSVYFADFMEECGIDIKGRRQIEGLNETEADFENVRAAWEWAVSRRNIEIITQMLEGVYWFCNMRSRRTEGKVLFRLAEDALRPGPDEIPHQLWGRLLPRYADSRDDLKTRTEKALAIAYSYEDEADIAFCLWQVGDYTIPQNELAISCYEQSIAHYQGLSDSFYATRVLFDLGFSRGMVGYSAHADTVHEGIEHCRANGDISLLALFLLYLSALDMYRGEYAKAEATCREIMAIWQEVGNQADLAIGKVALADALFWQGRIEETKILTEEAMPSALEHKNRVYEGFALVEFSRIANTEERYKEALKYAQDAIAIHHYNPVLNAYAHLAAATAACCLGDYAATKRHLQVARKSHPIHLQLDGVLTTYLPVFALILAHEKQLVYAVEILGLAFEHPVGPVGWMKQWPMLTRLRADLEADLGSGVYQAAWERGTALDLETTVAELMEEFTNE